MEGIPLPRRSPSSTSLSLTKETLPPLPPVTRLKPLLARKAPRKKRLPQVARRHRCCTRALEKRVNEKFAQT